VATRAVPAAPTPKPPVHKPQPSDENIRVLPPKPDADRDSDSDSDNNSDGGAPPTDAPGNTPSGGDVGDDSANTDLGGDSGGGAGGDSGGDAERRQRARSVTSTIATSPVGLLAERFDGPRRKTLLGG
jgi:hypothetical protein